MTADLLVAPAWRDTDLTSRPSGFEIITDDVLPLIIHAVQPAIAVGWLASVSKRWLLLADNAPDLKLTSLRKLASEWQALMCASSSLHQQGSTSLHLVEKLSVNWHPTLWRAISIGALASLETLGLGMNSIGDHGVQGFSGAVASGALASLKELRLNRNKIGNDGIVSLSSAIAGGALLNVKVLDLEVNQIGNEGIMAFSSAVVGGGLTKLETLNLYNNRIGGMFGDSGIQALASAIDTGMLANLSKLILSRNEIGDSGMEALSLAVSSEAMASLKTLAVVRNPGDATLVQAACDTRGLHSCFI